MRIVMWSCVAALAAAGPFGCPVDEDLEDEIEGVEVRAGGEAPPPSSDRGQASDPGQGGDVGGVHDGDPGSSGPAGAGDGGTAGEAVALRADKQRSKVGFSVSRATIGHVGGFGDFSAALTLDGGGEPIALAVRVKTASVKADRSGLTRHLLSADFFDVETYPEAGFEATTIAPVDGSPEHYTVTGRMTLHGKVQDLSFDALVEREAGLVRTTAELDISAAAFGITYGGMEAELAEDAVALEVALTFPTNP